MAYYSDRTTGYDPNETYGRHDHYGDGDQNYGVSHSHSYGHEYYYPSQQQQRYRTPAEYQYDHGEYDYPTGVVDPDPPHGTYPPDHAADETYGLTEEEHAPSEMKYGRRGSGRSHLSDVYQADESHGSEYDRDRKRRPRLLGTVFCFLTLAAIGVASGIMLAIVFLRPPGVGIAGYTAPSIYLQDQSLMMNTTVYAGVANANSVGAKIEHLHTTFYDRNYPDHVLGQSDNNNIQIDSSSNTTLKIPVEFELADLNDLNSSRVLLDMAQHCAWNLGDLTGALGSKLSSYDRRDVSRLAKRDGKVPLLIDLNLKVSVMSVGFHSSTRNVSLDVQCPSLNALLNGAQPSSSSSSSTPSSTYTSSSSTYVAPVPTTTSSSTYVAPSTTSASSTDYAPTTSQVPSPSPTTTYTYVPPSTPSISYVTETLTPTSTSTYSPPPTSTYEPPSSSSPSPTPVSTLSTDDNSDPFASSVIEHNPAASSAAAAGDTSAVSSIVTSAEGSNNVWSGLWSFITAGSMPIRRAVPTSTLTPKAVA